MTSLEKILSEMWYDPTEMANEGARIKYGKEILELIQNKYPNIAARIIKNKEIQNSSIEQDLFIEALRAVKDPKAEECLEQLEERISEVPAGTSKAMNNLSTIRVVAMIGSVVNASSVENCSWLLSLSAMFIYSGLKQLPFMSIKTPKDVMKYFNRRSPETLYNSAMDPEIHDFIEVLNSRHLPEPSLLFYKESENHYVFNHRNIKNYTIPVEDGSISKTSLDEKGNEIKTADVLSQMPEQLNDVFLESLKQKNIELPGEAMAENTSKKLASFSLEKILTETWFNNDELEDEYRRTDYFTRIQNLISKKYPNIAAKLLDNKASEFTSNPDNFVKVFEFFKVPRFQECLEVLETNVSNFPPKYSLIDFLALLETVINKMGGYNDNCNWLLSATALFLFQGLSSYNVSSVGTVEGFNHLLKGYGSNVVYATATDPETYSFIDILEGNHLKGSDQILFEKDSYVFSLFGVATYTTKVVDTGGTKELSETSEDDAGNEIKTDEVIEKFPEQMFDAFIEDLKKKDIKLPESIVSEEVLESISVGGGAFSGGPMGIIGRSKKKHKHGF